ncbi:phage baseplate assembly protein V [Pacificispira sp.]|uniref:phage baseplate assembly protein V n=1 Tax=Pacificispira sp. TaxID=2888761 RepID=UPI003BAAFB38
MRALQAIARRVAGLIVRGALKAVVDDGGLQRLIVSVLADEVLTVPRYQNYGFTAHPLPGATVVLLSANGVRDGVIAVVVEDQRVRPPASAPGDVAQYDFEGQVVRLTRNGVEIEGKNVLVKTPGVFRVDAGEIEMRAETSMQTEVYGYGERVKWTGAKNYTRDTFDTDAIVGGAAYPVSQPALDSEHPAAGGEGA